MMMYKQEVNLNPYMGTAKAVDVLTAESPATTNSSKSSMNGGNKKRKASRGG